MAVNSSSTRNSINIIWGGFRGRCNYEEHEGVTHLSVIAPGTGLLGGFVPFSWLFVLCECFGWFWGFFLTCLFFRGYRWVLQQTFSLQKSVSVPSHLSPLWVFSDRLSCCAQGQAKRQSGAGGLSRVSARRGNLHSCHVHAAFRGMGRRALA